MAVTDTVLEREKKRERERKGEVDSFHPCEICMPTDISLREKKEEREREREFHAREILITRSKWLEMFQTKLP